MAGSQEHIAERFYAAIERRAYDELLDQIYAPDARIWHNADNEVQSAAQNIQALRTVGAAITDWKYDLTHRIEFPGGFVQQFTTHLTIRDGRAFALYVCGIFWVRDERIARLDEYYDALSLQQVLEAAGL